MATPRRRSARASRRPRSTRSRRRPKRLRDKADDEEEDASQQEAQNETRDAAERAEGTQGGDDDSSDNDEPAHDRNSGRTSPIVEFANKASARCSEIGAAASARLATLSASTSERWATCSKTVSNRLSALFTSASTRTTQASEWALKKENRPRVALSVVAVLLFIFSFMSASGRLGALGPVLPTRRSIDWSSFDARVEEQFADRVSAACGEYGQQITAMEQSIARVKGSFEDYVKAAMKIEKDDLSDSIIRELPKQARSMLASDPAFEKELQAAVDKAVTTETARVRAEIEAQEAASAELTKSIESLQKAIEENKATTKAQISGVTEDLAPQIEALRAALEKKISEMRTELSKPLPESDIKAWTEEQVGARVESLMSAALEKYSADRTGLVDYALGKVGGKVVGSSKPLAIERRSNILNFGRRPRLVERPASLVLTPGIGLGECWPMGGSEGFVDIKLVKAIRPTLVSLEHPALSVSVTQGKSMPREFKVFGANEADTEAAGMTFLGGGEYKQDGGTLQQFALKASQPFRFIRFEVTSNYGDEYTCLYRIRVHGKPQDD